MKVYADIDNEINSTEIIRGMVRANKTAEDAIVRAERWAAGFHTAFEFAVYVGWVAFILYVCC